MLTEQKHETKALARDEARIITEFLIRDQEDPSYRNPGIIVAREEQFFYYVVNTNFEFLLGDELIPETRNNLLTIINNWNFDRDEFLFDSINVTVPKSDGELLYNQDGTPLFETEIRTIDLMMTSHPLIYNGQILGTVFIGKDISFFHELLRGLLVVLLAIAILFFGVAFFISYIMSKRTMVPISEAFTRQREFVADASHELRTPLSVLLSSINAIEMTEPFEQNSYPRKLLSNMKEEVKRMSKLVGDLLTIARSGTSTMEIVNKEIFDFHDPAEKVIQSVQALADTKQITIHFNAPNSLTINGDLEKLKQLLYILLDNAIKYTQNGGAVHVALEMRGDEKESALVIEVKDTGIGISLEDQQRIFDRFYRVDKARTRQLGGHGLGLSIAKWIVDIHGGTIRVTSELNRGSTFTVCIPTTLH